MFTPTPQRHARALTSVAAGLGLTLLALAPASYADHKDGHATPPGHAAGHGQHGQHGHHGADEDGSRGPGSDKGHKGHKDKKDKDRGKDKGKDKGKGDHGSGSGAADPAGNNGTVKVAPLGELDRIPDNTPHPGCTFVVEWYGFDEGDDIVSTVSFAMQAPTSDVALSVDGLTSVPVGGDPASGAGTDTGLDGRQPYTLSFDGEPHPKQGYHVTLTVATPYSHGNDTKSKVFWVAPCEPTEEPTEGPTEGPTDSPTAVPGSSSGERPGPVVADASGVAPSGSSGPADGVALGLAEGADGAALGAAEEADGAAQGADGAALSSADDTVDPALELVDDRRRRPAHGGPDQRRRRSRLRLRRHRRLAGGHRAAGDRRAHAAGRPGAPAPSRCLTPDCQDARVADSLTGLLTVVGVGLTAAGALALSPSQTATPAASAGEAITASPTGSPVPQPAPPDAGHAARAGAPRQVLVPTLGIDARVVPVGMTSDGAFVPPSDAAQLGWWAGGAGAGAPRGSTLVAGHTVHTGGGALDDLEQLRPGDAVVVRTAAGRVPYVVRTVRVLAKGRLAEMAETLFDQSVPGGRLVLLTCEDWDGAQYRSNVVVIAEPRRAG